jgi:RNA polymerase sigma-70 factor (ECF subfamily)
MKTKKGKCLKAEANLSSLSSEKIKENSISNDDFPIGGVDAINFESILKEHKNMIYTCLLHQVQNRDEADDLYQNVCLKIYKGLKDYKKTGSIKSWIATITQNEIRDFFRRKNRWFKIFSAKTSPKELISQSIENENDSPELNLQTLEIRYRLKKAITCLPKEQLEVISLHYIFELSYREISKILGISINTASARARYGLQKLKKILED